MHIIGLQNRRTLESVSSRFDIGKHDRLSLTCLYDLFSPIATSISITSFPLGKLSCLPRRRDLLTQEHSVIVVAFIDADASRAGVQTNPNPPSGLPSRQTFAPLTTSKTLQHMESNFVK